MYNVALFLHLLGVVLLAGSVSTTLVATVRSQTADSVGALRALIAVTQRIEIVIVPAMLLIVGTGLYMVSRHGGDGSINWSAGWVVVSLILATLLSVIGGTVEGGHTKRLRAASASDTSERPQADLRALQRARKPLYASFFSTSQLVALLFLMSNKPRLSGAITACVVAAIISVLAASLRMRAISRAPDASG